MTFEELAEYFSVKLKKDKSEIRPGSRIYEDLGADSLDVVSMLCEAEEKYAIFIPDDKVEELKTVEKVLNYITKKQWKE